jgi:signal transduction histidine kinase
MRLSNLKLPYLGIFFIIAVLIPSIILSFLALSSIKREEAYIEKQLRGSLLAEVIHVASLVNAEVKRIQDELDRGIGIVQGEDYEEYLSKWKQSSSMVGTPFLLSPDYEIILPNANKALNDEEFSFLELNRSFIADKSTTPVYENIAVAYKDEIINEQRAMPSWHTVESQEGISDSSSVSSGSQYSPPGSYSLGEGYRNQQAKIQFEQSEPVRKKVYETAKEKGREVLQRTVKLPEKTFKKSEESDTEESVFVSEALKFSQIIAKGDYGIIPRFADDKLNLLFWKKIKDGHVLGCVINNIVFRERIINVLPNIYSTARILTVLDEGGRPLITPQKAKVSDWRRPFVAREISEVLPRWEIAAYIADPTAVSLQARIRAVAMWMFILVLFVSIVVGGTLVLKALHSEMTLAQQKTTFVTNVSHELKTPLTSISMFAEMLKEKRQPDETKRERYLDIMVSETERLTRLINNVLDFSRMSQGKMHYNMKKIDIVDACRVIFENQRLRLENNGFGVKFISNIDHLAVKADEEAIKQVVLNILSNAEKYSTETKDIELEIFREEKSAIINIKDRGIGISRTNANRLFKAFYRADDSLTSKVRGTGLGLTISRQIIRDHGGDLMYFPNVGGGSIFQIELPLEEE